MLLALYFREFISLLGRTQNLGLTVVMWLRSGKNYDTHKIAP